MKTSNFLRPLGALVFLSASPVWAELSNYWPLNEETGFSAPNTVGTGVEAELFGTVEWFSDPERGQVLQFQAAGYADAGMLPDFPADGEFTWAFWANSTQGPNNNVIVGNRYPDDGWIKFTTNAFEFRDLPASYNATIDYPDFPTGQWIHHAVVKRGPRFTYFRNGVALRQLQLFVDAPAVPIYFGGDLFVENWAGMLDDVATWTSALPVASVAALAGGTVNPATAPLSFTPPATVVAFTDDFAGTLAAWTPADRGLESTLVTTYDPPAIVGGELVLGGTTDAQYWLGSSVVSNQAFDSRLYTEIEVTRTSLTGSGTAYRSSLWIFGDDTHFLHYSQNVGENGWQFNANDGSGQGTLLPIGSGNNIPELDDQDTDTGSKVMGVRLVPVPGMSGRVNMEMMLDGEVFAVHGFTEFPPTFRIILTGQARAIGDSVSAVFDDVRVRRENVANLPPAFSPTTATAPALAEGGSLSFDAGALASDPESNPLTFSKTSGPEWASVSVAGLITGTPPAGSAGWAQIGVRALDTVGLGTASFTLRVRIEPSNLPTPPLLGWWPLNDGEGPLAREATGGAPDGYIQNFEFGGLGPDDAAWADDPTYGPVLSFNGDDGTGAYVMVGEEAGAYSLPVFTLEEGFAWSLWVRPDQGVNNDIILGNRYDAFNVDFVPRDFVKFTSAAFEWHFNGAGENIDYPDLVPGAWVHLVAIKEGSTLYHYRNGVLQDARTITGAPVASLPLFIGGQGVENWRGFITDVRLYTGSLSDQAVASLFADGPGGSPPTPTTDFRITEFTRGTNGSLTISWPSQPGETYDVQWSTTLATAGWLGISGPISATGATTSFTLAPGGAPDPATAPAGYLRVRRL